MSASQDAAAKGNHYYPVRSSQSDRPVRRLGIRSVEERRVEEFSSGQWSKWNINSVLFEAKTDEQEVIKLGLWVPKNGTKPGFEEAVKQTYGPVKKGHKFGPSWSNHWLRIHINVPSEWRDKEGVQLEFDPSCEAMIFNEGGLPLQGITGGGDGRRVDFPLKKEMRKSIVLYAEVTCNALFGLPHNNEGDPDPNRYFSLESADVVVKRLEAWHLLWDYHLLQGCIREMPKDSVLQNKALYVMQQIQNTFRRDDLSTIGRCRSIAEEVLGKGWSSKGSQLYEEGNVFQKNDHILWAVGHTHIDSAWLWPFTATQQKVARSWSTQLDLMDRYPEYKFTASTAQQYWWLEQLYPKLFEKVQSYVKKGRFIPIGGTWVENDANLPSGEAFVRQFLYGQRFFKTRFGQRTNIFWLPDTFGYNSQIPQLARSCGTEYFFTQKLSWSNVNRFPHNTVMWTGLDGTQIITHMTPVNNYDSMCGVDDIRRGLTNNQNLGVQPTALLLYGKGDGGGGPSEANIEALRRARATYNAGHTDMPKVTSDTTPLEFFENIRKITDNGERLPTWSGEIYLEFHRGVYTSHGSIKRWNRKLEILLHQLEWIATLASVAKGTGGYVYPKADLDHLWEPFLLCQFHDVLPGSSIRMVYDDAETIYADVNAKARKLLQKATTILQQQHTSLASKVNAVGQPVALNTLGIPRRELVRISSTVLASLETTHRDMLFSNAVQQTGDDVLVLLEDTQGNGMARLAPSPSTVMRSLEAVSVQERAHGNFTMRNNAVALSVDQGRISSLQVLSIDGAWREILADGRTAGLSICEDFPPDYDAWETEIYSLDTDRELKFDNARVTQRGPWRAAMELEYKFGKSSVTINVSLDALPASHLAAASGSSSAAKQARSLVRFDAQVHWQEKHKFLRFEVPTILRADLASYETQFGITKRPTVRNTSWDAAKFEVCGHKFADLSESSLGLALVTDSKYGYSVEGGRMRVSLLKGATYPDAHQDEGDHSIAFGLYPHLSQLEASDVVHVGRIFNEPLEMGTDAASTAVEAIESAAMPIKLDLPKAGAPQATVLDTIKRGEDDFEYYGQGGRSDSKTVIVRVYESLGSHASPVLSTTLPVKEVKRTNMLEDDDEEASKTNLHVFRPDAADGVSGGDCVTKIALKLQPFEVATIKLRF